MHQGVRMDRPDDACPAQAFHVKVLRELADSFNSFYHFDPVLKSEGNVRNRRLTLVKAAQNTLKESLETLGIDAISTM
jgi:arginyl-tRNA synthetase